MCYKFYLFFSISVSKICLFLLNIFYLLVDILILFMPYFPEHVEYFMMVILNALSVSLNVLLLCDVIWAFENQSPFPSLLTGFVLEKNFTNQLGQRFNGPLKTFLQVHLLWTCAYKVQIREVFLVCLVRSLKSLAPSGAYCGTENSLGLLSFAQLFYVLSASPSYTPPQTCRVCGISLSWMRQKPSFAGKQAPEKSEHQIYVYFPS